MVEGHMNPLNAYLNTMHVKTDVPSPSTLGSRERLFPFMGLCSQYDVRMSNRESNELSSQDPLMIQVIRVDLDKLREQARQFGLTAHHLHQRNWHPPTR